MANGRSDGSVIIDTLVDTRGFGKGVNNMKRQMGGLTGAINKLGLAIAATFGISRLVKFGKSAIELGSDLEEVQNVVDVTFTSMSENVNEFAKSAAEAAGLSETMAKKYVGTFGAMSKAFGFMEEEAFAMSSTLTQMVGDVASFYNLTQDEAYTKLKSVFTGETESLKDLGVVMTQSALDSFAMAKGYGKTTKAMSEQEKVSLRYAFVLEQLSAAQGDFVRTSDSWANQTRILSLNFDTFKANVGKALINIFTPFLKVLNQLVAKLAQLSQHFVAFSELLVGKSTSGGGGSPGDALEGIEEGYENIADAADEATKSQNKYLTGLDEIRTFAESDALENSSELDFGEIKGSSDVVEDEVNNTTDLIDKLEEKFPNLIKFLRDSFNKIKEIFNDFKIGDFFSAGQDISQLVTGIYNFVAEAIDRVEWKELGNEIGNFIAGIEWIEVIKSGLKLGLNIWEAIAEVWLGMWETAPFETAFISAIAAMQFLGLGPIIANHIISAIPAILHVGKIILLTGIGFQIGTEIGKELGQVLFPEDAELYANFKWFGDGGFFDEFFSSDLEIHMMAIKSWLEEMNGPAGKIISFKEAMEDAGLTFIDVLKAMSISLGKSHPEFGRWFDVASKVFSAETWDGVFVNFSSIFSAAFKGIANKAIEFLNSILQGIEDMVNNGLKSIAMLAIVTTKLTGVKFDLPSEKFTIPKIPYLASGAVIPPNAPFMAVLGDQRHGTNIEAPLDTIKQAVREVIGSGNGGKYQFTAQLNRRTLFDEFIEEAKLRQSTTGRNPLDLA